MLRSNRESLWYRWHLGALLSSRPGAKAFCLHLASCSRGLPGGHHGRRALCVKTATRIYAEPLVDLATALLGESQSIVTNMIWYPTPISLYYATL